MYDNACTHLFKLVVGNVHEPARAEHLEALRAQVARDRLHQSQRALDGVLGLTDAAHVREDGLQRDAHAIELGGREQVVQREVLHQRVVVVDRR